MSGKPYSLFSAFCLPQLPGERAGGLMKFRDRVLGWVYVKGPVMERVEESFNKACISLYLCKLSPQSTWFLLLLLKPLLCCFSAHLLDPDHSWVFFNTLNLYYTMPCARIFPSGGREKKPQTHQNPVAWFPVQLACSFPGFYSHHQSGLTDREQTSGSPWTHGVPFPSQNKHQVTGREKEKGKKKIYFPDLEANSEWSPTLIPDSDVVRLWLSSRVEPWTVGSGPEFLSESVLKEKPCVDGLLCSPRSSLFPGIESSRIWGSLPRSRWLHQTWRRTSVLAAVRVVPAGSQTARKVGSLCQAKRRCRTLQPGRGT